MMETTSRATIGRNIQLFLIGRRDLQWCVTGGAVGPLGQFIFGFQFNRYIFFAAGTVATDVIATMGGFVSAVSHPRSSEEKPRYQHPVSNDDEC